MFDRVECGLLGKVRVNQKERSTAKVWVYGYALVVMILTTLPYVIGFLSQGQDWRFSGFVFGVTDGNSYIAKMYSGTAGEWLFRSPFSATHQRGGLFYLPYLLLGKLALFPGDTHLQLVILFHLFRIAAGLAMIVATYDFISVFLSKEPWRRWALVVITLGGGLGWLVVLRRGAGVLGSMPLDFVSPESFGFLALYGLPHLAAARALLLWGLRSFLLQKMPLLPGLLWFVLGFFQPISVLIAWVVATVYVIFNLLETIQGRDHSSLAGWFLSTKNLQKLFWSVVISSPLVIYTIVKSQTDPYISAWSAQNRILSPHPVHYLAAYGLVAVFLIPGVSRMRKETPEWGWMPIGWIVLMPLLVYAPVVIQRRLAEGVWVPMVIVAVKAFESDYRPLSVRWSYLWGAVFPSSILLLVWGAGAARSPRLPLFRPEPEVKSFLYIAENMDRNAVFLTSFQTGNALPAWAPVHVVLGHGPETVDHHQVRKDVDLFYSSGTGKEIRREILKKYHTDFVFWGPRERKLGAWDPRSAAYLSLVYERDPYRIFQVTQRDE